MALTKQQAAQAAQLKQRIAQAKNQLALIPLQVEQLQASMAFQLEQFEAQKAQLPQAIAAAEAELAKLQPQV